MVVPDLPRHVPLVVLQAHTLQVERLHAQAVLRVSTKAAQEKQTV